MKNKKVLLVIGVLIVIIIIATILVYDNYREEEEDVIKIGVIAPLSGDMAKFGEWMMNGLEISKDEINSKGGINGKKIKLIYEDEKCSPIETLSILNRLAIVDNINFYIGPFCGSSIIISSVFFNDNKIIGVTPSTNFGKMNDYHFSTNILLERESEAIAEYSYDYLGLRNIGIIYFQNEWGENHKKSFINVFEKKGGNIVATEGINSFSQTDFRSILSKIKDRNADGLYFLLTNSNLVKQSKEIGFNGILLGEYNIENPDFTEIDDQIIYYAHPNRINESQIKLFFDKKYREKYNEDPIILSYESYDALQLLALSISRCEDYNLNCVKESIYLTNFEGVTGRIIINKDNNDVISKFPIIKMFNNGSFNYLEY